MVQRKQLFDSFARLLFPSPEKILERSNVWLLANQKDSVLFDGRAYTRLYFLRDSGPSHACCCGESTVIMYRANIPPKIIF